jgi:hypothetical protein
MQKSVPNGYTKYQVGAKFWHRFNEKRRNQAQVAQRAWQKVRAL